MRLVERGAPQLPAVDQRAAKHKLDQLEVERATGLERRHLLEEVELPVKHEGLGSIGGGLLTGGRPWHGLVHPEVGHIRVPRDHDPDRASFPGICPVHGDCWEGVASGPAIAERCGCRPEELSEDHPVWKIEAEYLAVGILSIVLVSSPERLIVGGGVMEHQSLLETVRGRVRALLGGYLETPALSEEIGSYLVSPGLGERAGVLGAIALAQTVDV